MFLKDVIMLSDSVVLFGKYFTIYWHGLILALGVVCAFLITYLFWSKTDAGKERGSAPILTIAGIGGVLGIILARAQYCYFNPEIYSDHPEKIVELTNGGYGLFMGMVGVFIAAWISSKIFKLPLIELLDVMSPGAALGIFIGRFGSYFSGDDLGVAVHSAKWHFFPISVYSESAEAYQLCVYPYEAVAALIAFFAAWAMLHSVYIKQSGTHRKGDTFIIFLIIYSAFQIVLESLRNDALFLNLLGFVRFTQVACAIILGTISVIGCVRIAKKKGFNPWQILLWVLIAGMFTLAFVMEFTLTSGTLIRNYSLMSGALVVISIATLCCILSTGIKPEKSPKKAEKSADQSAAAPVLVQAPMPMPVAAPAPMPMTPPQPIMVQQQPVMPPQPAQIPVYPQQPTPVEYESSPDYADIGQPDETAQLSALFNNIYNNNNNRAPFNRR